MLSNSIESEFSTLNWIAESEKIRYVFSRDMLINTAAITEVNSTEIDSKFYGERNTGLRAITAPSYKQTKHAIEFTYLAIFKWTKIN